MKQINPVCKVQINIHFQQSSVVRSGQNDWFSQAKLYTENKTDTNTTIMIIRNSRSKKISELKYHSIIRVHKESDARVREREKKYTFETF